MKKPGALTLLVVNYSANKSADTIRSLRSAFVCEILFADSPEDALAVLRQHHPRVALVSSEVKLANGIPISRFIRQVSPDTGVLVVDEYFSHELRSALSLKAGITQAAKVARAFERRIERRQALTRH